jgi:hypothetical protein
MAVLSCELVWLAWWQLSFDTVVFKYRLVTALVPVTSDSRILSLTPIFGGDMPP